MPYVAVDLGAESGRVVHGAVDGGRVALRELHRFPTLPARLADGPHTDVPALLDAILHALRAAPPARSMAIDSWAVDYGLLDARGELLGLPHHYRSPRTEGMVERVAELVSPETVYERTGIQSLPINTLPQLLAEPPEVLQAASRLLLLPDLLAYELTGVAVCEATNASTTQLYDAVAGDWAWDVIDAVGLPRRLFGPVVPPGHALGPVRAEHGAGALLVRTTASHDTAAAVAAVPMHDPARAAYISCGTWALVGVELEAPVRTDAAREDNLTNELGLDGTTRFLRNVMGLWLVQECRRAWGDADDAELVAQAALAPADGPLVDPDDPSLLAAGDMPGRLATLLQRQGDPVPASRGALVRCILESLACRFRWVLERLEAATGHSIEVVHVVGGGARNALLCQLTADVGGRPVLAGPVEATALGNVLVQAAADGVVEGRHGIRELARASAAPRRFDPRDAMRAAQRYERFLERLAARTVGA